MELDEPDKTARSDLDTMFASLDSFLPAHPSRGYAEFFIPNLPSSTQQGPTQSVSPIPISFCKTQLTTPVPVPLYPLRHAVREREEQMSKPGGWGTYDPHAVKCIY
ncbi:hypothetical protein F4782DRAFT_519991 [Xylaria castorea]|nr:hypothetical protein F4782DRAFT_519991 [Xylaria castorea]